ncbi:MAG TPA: ABC transporter substrate-binding protein [Thermoanaerobaculia bacterium]
MKHLRWLCVVALGLCAAAGCARREAASAPVKETLYRHLDGDPATLDPTTTNEDFGLRVEDLIFRPLVGIDKDRHIAPSLALSWAVSTDGLVYDFRLDPKVRWEDGSPVTSADVAFTIERVRDPKVPAVTWRWGFEDLAAVETPDPATVIVRFQKPYAERLLAFTLPVVSAAAYAQKRDNDRAPFGSGPYRLESWEPGQKLTLARRPDASASDFPFAKVVFRVIPDNTVRFRAGSRGELDEFKITRDQRPVAEKSEEFLAHNRIVEAPQFLTVMVIWNVRQPFLSDRRVRQALALSWAREDAAKRLYPPTGAALVSGPYPAGAEENATDVAVPREDIPEAERLLDAAGWRRGSPGAVRQKGSQKASFEILYPASAPIYANIAQILKQAYEKVGVDLELRSLDWAAYTNRVEAGEFEACPYANTFWPPNLDQYPYFHSSQAPPNGQNNGFYRNPEVDRALEAARRETDGARRLELYRQVHRLLAADPPADFLWSVGQFWGISKSLAGVELSPIGLFHFLPGPLGWKPVPASK